MQPFGKRWLVLALGLSLLAGIARSANAASPFAGTWAATVVENGQEITVWLLKVEDKDGKPVVQVVGGLPNFKDAKVTHLSGDAKTLRLTLEGSGRDFALSVGAPGNDKSKRLLGSVQIGSQAALLILEPTEQTSVDPAKAVRPAPGFDDLRKALRESDTKAKVDGLKAVLEKNQGKPIEVSAAQALAELEIDKGDSKAAKEAADRYLKVVAPYGRVMEQNAAIQLARLLGAKDKEPALALEYARKATALLQDDDAPSQTSSVLKVLAAALRKAGKKDEVKAIDARLTKLEDVLDQEFVKSAVPFDPKPFAGRKGKSDHVVVLELFTGAQCPPCVSADIAFDAALKAYKPGDVVLLQYHLHIPGPDPLTNADSEARQKYYGDAIRGTPTMFVDGKATAGLGGYRPHGKDRFETLSKLVNEALEKDPQAQIRLKADRKADKIDVTADVADLKKTGDKVRLRFALVEDVVRYPGRNGQRLHHHVVRAFPGGEAGFALGEKSVSKTVSLSLADLHKTLADYLDASGKRHPYLDDERPLKLEHLKVVAFVQDDDNKEILQAAQIDIPEGK